jgi:hypothetical protein
LGVIEYLVHDPVGQCTLAPFLAATILTLSLRLVFGVGLGVRIAPLAIALACMGGFLLILGMPPLPPVSSTQKLFFIAVITPVIGVAVEYTRSGLVLERAVLWLVPLGALLWLAARLLIPLHPQTLVDMAALYAGTIIAHWCLLRAEPSEAPLDAGLAFAPSILVMTAAIGLGALAMFGGAPIVAQLDFIMASACGGYVLIGWLFHVFKGEHFRFGTIGRTGILNVISAVTAIYVLFSDQPNRYALVLVSLIFPMHFIAISLARRVQPSHPQLGYALRPICYGLIVSTTMTMEIFYVLVFAPHLFQQG